MSSKVLCSSVPCAKELSLSIFRSFLFCFWNSKILKPVKVLCLYRRKYSICQQHNPSVGRSCQTRSEQFTPDKWDGLCRVWAGKVIAGFWWPVWLKHSWPQWHRTPNLTRWFLCEGNKTPHRGYLCTELLVSHLWCFAAHFITDKITGCYLCFSCVS